MMRHGPTDPDEMAVILQPLQRKKRARVATVGGVLIDSMSVRIPGFPALEFSVAVVQLLSRVWLFAPPWTGFPVSHHLPEFRIIYTFIFHFKETRLLLIKENVWKLLKPVILPIFSRFTVSKLKFTLSNSNARIWSYTQSAKCFLDNESLRVHHPTIPR